MIPLAKHTLIDLRGCDRDKLIQVPTVRQILLEAARVAEATIITDHFHQFSPYGVSGVIVISESHLCIHTWPEYRVASVDLFTCGTSVKEDRLIEFLKNVLGAETVRVSTLSRG